MRNPRLRLIFFCGIVATLTGCSSGGSGCEFLDLACARRISPTPSTLSIFGLRDARGTSRTFAGPQLQFERVNPATTESGPGQILIRAGGRTGAPGDSISLTRFDGPAATFVEADRIDPAGGTFDVFRRRDGAAGTVEFALTVLNMQFGGSGLEYATYGIWDDTNLDPRNPAGQFARAGAMAFGVPTPSGNMPATGSATYLGRMDGRFSDALAPNRAVTGTTRLDANFTAGTVTGLLSNVTVAGSPFRNISVNSSISNNTNFGGVPVGAFAGTLATAPATPGQAGPDMSGTVQGNFFGPAAQELGGIFELSGGGAVMVGGLVGKR